jgi:sugar phosphate permease
MTNYLIRGALPSLIPLIAESQGWSQGQVAILFSAFPTGYVLTQIPAGACLCATCFPRFATLL